MHAFVLILRSKNFGGSLNHFINLLFLVFILFTLFWKNITLTNFANPFEILVENQSRI